MNEKISDLNSKFWDDFSSLYKKNKGTNSYLYKTSNEIEKTITKMFKNYGLEEEYSIFAIGGFGKKEMFPSSDIDISIIKNNKNIKKEADLEKFIASLWDLGWKIGCSVRSLSELKNILRKDAKELTSYFSLRPLISNKNIEARVNKITQSAWNKNAYFKAKIIEQQERYYSFDSSAFNLEPDLKESPGTMRDFQNAEWILNYCLGLDCEEKIKTSDIFHSSYFEARKSYEFIKTIRYATNLATKNKNRLNFESQIDIAKKAIKKNLSEKDKVETLMQKFFFQVQTITSFNQLVEQVYAESRIIGIKKKKGNFFYKGNQIGILETDIKNNREILLDIFIELGKNNKVNQIHSESINTLKKSSSLIDNEFRSCSSNSSKFLKILRSKYHLSSILKLMKMTGILQKYIPEFDEVIGQMQFDLFHIYTVDEHTLKVVRNMRQMKIKESDEFLLENELIKKIPKVELLYIAGLFHDLGKGKGGNHSEIGAKTSMDFAKRLGLSVADSELISWLVLNHLKMSSISQRKDISDPKTINEFAEIVLNTERLDYLYLLTINDIRSTNPKLWNAWKHGLLRDLFLSTRSYLNKEPVKTSREISSDRKNSIYKLLEGNELTYLKSVWGNFDDSYFNKHLSDSLKWQSDLILSKPHDGIKVACRKCFDNLLEIFIKVDNSDGLFLKIVKILDSVGLEIVDASIYTSKDNLMAMNTFVTKFHSHDNPLLKSEIGDIKSKIINNFKKFTPSKRVRKKLENKAFKNKVKISNIEDADNKKNHLTIEAFDSPGILIKIAEIFYKNNVSIQSARINTLGEKVEDTFEIKDITISSVSKKKIEKISNALEEII
jgi:[protein-PII] uridylyltransferase